MNSVEWLKSYLSARQPANVRDIRECAKGFGIKRKKLQEAKKLLGVVVTNDFVKGHGAENWYWSLPNSTKDDAV